MLEVVQNRNKIFPIPLKRTEKRNTKRWLFDIEQKKVNLGRFIIFVCSSSTEFIFLIAPNSEECEPLLVSFIILRSFYEYNSARCFFFLVNLKCCVDEVNVFIWFFFILPRIFVY